MSGIRQLPSRRRFLWLAALVAAVAGLAAAVNLSGTVVALDGAIAAIARPDAAAAPATAWIEAVTALGATDTVLLVTALAAAALLALRRWHAAIALALSVAATQAVVALVKTLVERPRPDANGAVAEASGFSFPSAHSATSVALYAMLGLLAARACKGHARLVAIAVGIGVALAIGASRVYLGAHYPVDVLAGWLTGGAVVIACWAAASRLRAILAPVPASG